TVGWGGVREATDLHGGDAQAVAAADGELPPLVVDDLPHLGDVPEGGEHEAGQRVVVAGRHVEAAHVEHLVVVEGSVEDPLPRSLDPREAGPATVVLVVDLPDDLLEDVLEGDDAGGAAVLVDHDGQVVAAAAQGGQEVGEVPGLRDDEGRGHDRADRGGGPIVVGHAVDVLHVDHAHHVVQVLTDDGEAGLARGHGPAGQVGQRVVGAEGLDAGAGHEG